MPAKPRARMIGALTAALATAPTGTLTAMLGGLLPCPLCGVRPAGATGCCTVCRRRSLLPGRSRDLLWLGPYCGSLGRAVRALKYRGVTRLSVWLGGELAAHAARSGSRPSIVCDVPLHRSRLRQRGYNQSALLARRVAHRLGVPYRPLLQRVRPTRPQARLQRAERPSNVAGAFVGHSAAGHRVLLVDDVLTTGATAAACRSALLTAGAVSVVVAVVARVGAPADAPATHASATLPAPSARHVPVQTAIPPAEDPAAPHRRSTPTTPSGRVDDPTIEAVRRRR